MVANGIASSPVKVTVSWGRPERSFRSEPEKALTRPAPRNPGRAWCFRGTPLALEADSGVDAARCY